MAKFLCKLTCDMSLRLFFNLHFEDEWLMSMLCCSQTNEKNRSLIKQFLETGANTAVLLYMHA